MVSNTLLTIDMVTRKALQLFRNTNAFMMAINRDYSSQFAKVGAKIGDTLRIRKPVSYTVRSNATWSGQNTTEEYVTLTVNTMKGVDVAFTSTEQVMQLDDFSDIILEPAMNALAAGVAVDIMGGIDQVPNVVSQTSTGFNDGGTMVSPTAKAWLLAGAYLDQLSCPRDRRSFILNPISHANTVAGLAGLLNPGGKIGEQYSRGLMGTDSLGGQWFNDQTTKVHTTGAYSTLANINGSNQTGSSITVSALAGPLKAGDFVTLPGVNLVNLASFQDTGRQATFVITADAAASDTTIHVYPPLVPVSGSPNTTQYANVSASPTTGQPIDSPIAASATYIKNFLFHPSAVTCVFVDLPTYGKGVVDSARASYDRVSLRTIQYYDGDNDTLKTRMDVLYGWLVTRPEWICVITDVTD